MDNKKLKINDKVWVYDEYLSDNIDYVKITSELKEGEGYKYYNVHSIENGWDCGALIEHIFKTKEEAIEFAKKQKQKNYDQHASKINSVEDLIKSAYSLACCNESPDWDVLNAIKDKAKELLNLDL